MGVSEIKDRPGLYRAKYFPREGDGPVLPPGTKRSKRTDEKRHVHSSRRAAENDFARNAGRDSAHQFADLSAWVLSPWFKQFQLGRRVDPKTAAGEARSLELVIDRFWSDRKLGEITTADLARMCVALKTEWRSSSLISLIQRFKLAFRSAVEAGLLTFDPALNLGREAASLRRNRRGRGTRRRAGAVVPDPRTVAIIRHEANAWQMVGIDLMYEAALSSGETNSLPASAIDLREGKMRFDFERSEFGRIFKYRDRRSATDMTDRLMASLIRWQVLSRDDRRDRRSHLVLPARIGGDTVGRLYRRAVGAPVQTRQPRRPPTNRKHVTPPFRLDELCHRPVTGWIEQRVSVKEIVRRRGRKSAGPILRKYRKQFDLVGADQQRDRLNQAYRRLLDD